MEKEKNKEKIELTILMPCLNEEANIEYCIKAALCFLHRYDICGEILIVDNGSCDSSVQLASALGVRVVHEPSQGYGSALRKGIHEAYGHYIIIGDCDTTYDFSNLMPFLSALRSGSDLVVGNRFAGGIQKGAMPFSHRYIGVPILSWLGRKRYGVNVTDFHCGLRGLNRITANTLSFTSTGMEFATELIGRFASSNAKITEIPTTLSVSRQPRKPHLKAFRDGLRHIGFMLKRLD